MARSRDGYRYREGPLYCWSKMIDGKRHVIKARSHAERERRVKDRKNELANRPTSDPLSVLVFCEHWLELYVKKNRAYKTHRSYSQMLRTHVYPAIGDKKLPAVSSGDLQTILNVMTSAQKSPTTVRYMRMILNLVFKKAKADGMVALNPAASLSVPSAEEAGKRVLDDDEARKLAAYDGSRYSPLFVFLLSTGLRISEALSLRPEDIEGGVVRVENQLVWFKDGRYEIGRLKTPAAKRMIGLSTAAKDALDRASRIKETDWLLAGKGYVDSGFIFCSESGKPLTPSNVYRALSQSLVTLKIRKCSVHDLRRTFLTRLARVESRPQVLKAIAGHTSLSTTMQFYITSVRQDEHSAIIQAMNGIM